MTVDLEHRGIDDAAVDDVELVGSADQVPADPVRGAHRGRDGEQHDLNSVHLSLFDGFGQVIVAGDEEEHIRGSVAGVSHQVQADAQVHALLLAVDAEAAETELDLGKLTDAFLLRVGDAVAGRVVPIHPQHRQPRPVLRGVHQRADQRGVVDVNPAA